ncbi:MAG: hypothetical protein ACYCYO_04500 [Bacilli bacterium]
MKGRANGSPRMMGNSIENSELTASVADVLWLFSALYDGPPPEPLWQALRETVWPHLKQAVGDHGPMLELPAWDADRLGAEYDQWLAIPVAGQGALGYPPERVSDQGGEDSVEAMARLADLLGVEWEKPSFRPGSAYPVRPDHLTVLWALLAILLTMPGTDQLGERRVQDWSQAVWSLIRATLTRLQEILPTETAYAAITRIALGYGAEAAVWQEIDLQHE